MQATAVLLLFLAIYCSNKAAASPVAGSFDDDQGSAKRPVEDIDEMIIDMKEMGVEYFPDGRVKYESIEKLFETYRMGKTIKQTKIRQHVESKDDKQNVRGKRLTFGIEERLPVPDDYSDYFPYCAIGELDNGCSVVFIGPYHALTTASCVYNTFTNSWRDIKTITRKRNCNTEGIEMSISAVRSVVGFTVYELFAYNFALIITQSISPTPCYAGFGFISDWLDRGFDIIGYPSDKTVLQLPNCSYDSLFSSSCHYSNVTGSSLQYRYRCDTQGMYGAPLFSEVPDEFASYIGQRVVYGVHSNYDNTFLWNFGTRITRDRYIQIIRWMIESGYNPLTPPSPTTTSSPINNSG